MYLDLLLVPSVATEVRILHVYEYILAYETGTLFSICGLAWSRRKVAIFTKYVS